MAPRNKAAKKKTKAPAPPPKRKSNKTMILALAIIAVVVVAFGALVITGQLNQTSTSSSDHYLNAQEVLLQTSMGNITIALRNDKPHTTANFINLINQGLYDNTTFHRIIAGFMIQGGQLANGVQAPTINDEIGSDNHNYNGTIAMAKTNAANSASSEFFINVADNSQITYSSGTKFDETYTVFGKVISGMDVAMAISNVPTDSNDAPLQTVSLISVSVLP